MAIQLHSKQRGTEKWSIRNAYIDWNKEVFARENNPNIASHSPLMSRDRLRAKAVEAMHQWINSGAEYDAEFRIIDTATLLREERLKFEKGRT